MIANKFDISMDPIVVQVGVNYYNIYDMFENIK